MALTGFLNQLTGFKKFKSSLFSSVIKGKNEERKFLPGELLQHECVLLKESLKIQLPTSQTPPPPKKRERTVSAAAVQKPQSATTLSAVALLFV